MAPRILQVLKADGLGRVECLGDGDARWVRRVAAGSRLPLSGFVARVLLRRERRALEVLRERLGPRPDLPWVTDDPRLAGLPGPDGRAPRADQVLVRAHLPGAPLHAAEHLPRDFFDRLDELVGELHGAGVCHNDLHKEQNVLVLPDGRPALIDFQLASVHDPAAPGRAAARLASRAREDLRHVQKHRRRYTRDGRGPADAPAQGERGRGAGTARGPLARTWRRLGKPLYNGLTRGLLRTRDGEPRRPSSGPWPSWGPPVGPRCREGERDVRGTRGAITDGKGSCP